MLDFILQLHITGNCNLRCQHCYIEEHHNDLSYPDIQLIVAQFEQLITHLEAKTGDRIRAHIHFTGGEPLIHPEINKILRLFISKRTRFQYGIMSNGTVLKVKTLLLLKRLHLKAFQLSLDGDETTHDSIRGIGNYQRVLRAMDILYLFHIPTRVSFTACKENYTKFPFVADVCRKHRVRSLWSDRYIPFYSQVNLAPLDKDDMREYAEILQRERDNPYNKISNLCVQNYRALQFLCSGQNIYYCKAGETMITIDEHGNILPCRRLPIICGNVRHSELTEIYENNEVFQKLRAHNLTEKCKDCQYGSLCKGGERCFTYAIAADFERPDPSCWL